MSLPPPELMDKLLAEITADTLRRWPIEPNTPFMTTLRSDETGIELRAIFVWNGISKAPETAQLDIPTPPTEIELRQTSLRAMDMDALEELHAELWTKLHAKLKAALAVKPVAGGKP